MHFLLQQWFTIFDLIKKASKADWREMVQVFNVGTRMEIYTSPSSAEALIKLAKSFGVEAKIIGRVEKSVKKELFIHLDNETLIF